MITAAPYSSAEDLRRKRAEKLRAQLALLAGITMRELADGAWLLSSPDSTHRCEDLAQVAAFVAQLEARH